MCGGGESTCDSKTFVCLGFKYIYGFDKNWGMGERISEELSGFWVQILSRTFCVCITFVS